MQRLDVLIGFFAAYKHVNIFKSNPNEDKSLHFGFDKIISMFSFCFGNDFSVPRYDKLDNETDMCISAAGLFLEEVQNTDSKKNKNSEQYCEGNAKVGQSTI